MTATLVLTGWPVALVAGPPATAGDLPLADFGSGSYGPWRASGPAFGTAPSQLPGHRALRVASSDRRAENGKGTEGSLYSPDFVIERDFLNLQLAGGDHAFRAAASLWVDGRVVRTSAGGNRKELAWVTWDVREFKGRKASLGLHDYCSEEEMDYVMAGEIELSVRPRSAPVGDVAAATQAVRRAAVEAIRRNAARAAADPYRPIYHYTPPAQRMNDPNGPAWSNGYHHVFYQHMVFVGYGPATNVHWGHARSRDLVNWETLPLAVHPAYELGELSCFSGNLAWDKKGDPVQFVTMVPYKKDTFRQIWPARPLDPEWIKWERIPEKPPPGLVPAGEPAERHLKDAFPFSAGDRRFLVLTDRDIPVYEALDDRLTTWQRRGVVDPESAECPNFFEVDGRWVYLSSPHQPVRYQVGDFDPATARFTPKTEGRVNHDAGFYASTTYRDDRGRTILLGVTRGQKDGRGWTGALAMPRVLSIGPDDRPRIHPLPELATLRREPFRLQPPLELANRAAVVAGLEGDALEIVAKFRVRDAKSFGLQVRRSGDGSRFLPVQWSEGEITVGRPTPKYPCRYEIDPATREVIFRVFLDKGILDACTEDGRVFESRVHYAPLDDLKVAVFAEGGEATLVSLEAWKMAPARIDHSLLLGAPRAVPTATVGDSGASRSESQNEREIGREAARKLAARLGGRGRVILLRRQIQVFAAEQREEGFLEIMTREFPGVTLVATDYHAGPTQESARRVMTTLLERYGRDVQGIFISTETSALGALAALREAGLDSGRVQVVTVSEGRSALSQAHAGGDIQELLEGAVPGAPLEGVKPVGPNWPSIDCLESAGSDAADRVVPELGLRLVSIQPGVLVGGQPGAMESRVVISQRYWLGKYEVTQREWNALMDYNPSDFQGPCLPVDGVSWEEAVDFCARLTERERQAGRLPSGYIYALPTEAQWEYACLAGGPAVEVSAETGWCRSNSGAVHAASTGWRMSTHPVGTCRANAWGLHDMLGNVAEWCADWSGDYPVGAVTDYAGPASGTHRALRGGSWWSDPQNCRSDHRHRAPPGRKHSALGFRIALVPASSISP